MSANEGGVAERAAHAGPRAVAIPPEALERLAGRRLLIVGDVLLDRYLWGSVDRVSPEAPVPVVLQSRTTEVGGGAMNVARNVVAAGGSVAVVGIVGDDEEGRRLRAMCADADHLVLAPDRPTAVKTRVMAGGQQLIRLDREVVAALPVEIEEALISAIRRVLDAGDVSGVVLSDYAKGVLSRGVARAAIDGGIARGIPVVVDPKRSDLAFYRGADYLTPNLKEASAAAGMPLHGDADVECEGRLLLARYEGRGILITRGEEGVSLIRRDAPAVHVPAHAREIFDVTGAGDTLIAHFALALAAGLDPETAARVGNAAAGVAVTKVGAVTVSPAELVAAATGAEGRSKLRGSEDLRLALDRLRSEGRSVVFTNGCFDLFHAGHVRLLEAARGLGDTLVVGLNSDASVRRLHGPPRPILPARDRASVLSALPAVDFLVFFDEDTPERLLAELRPDVLVKGARPGAEVVGADLVRAWGGRVVELPLLEGVETGAILRRVTGADEEGDPSGRFRRDSSDPTG